VSAPNWFVGFPVGAPALPGVLSAPPPHVRVFPPDDLHATLAFFGSVSEARALAGWGALEIALASRDVSLGAVVPLGDARKPSALSSLITDAELTQAIGSARDRALRAADARLDDRPPLAHVTLARIAREATEPDRRLALAWAASLALASVRARIDTVALYTWAPDRRERLFRIVASRPLG
jgi:2'-5' RNA ligase